MFHTITYPRRQPWLPNLSQQIRRGLTTLTPPPAQQVHLHVGDSYHLAAGHYQVPVLAAVSGCRKSASLTAAPSSS